MNTFENELSTLNLSVMLACKDGVDTFYLDLEDCIEIKYGNSGALTHVEGPAKLLIIYD